MKIAVLIGNKLRSELFTESSIARLGKFGDVYCNKGEGPAVEDLDKLVKDADVIVTSWGSPVINEHILSVAPRLRLVAHAAGSVKPIVSDALFDHGVKISSSACVLSRGVSEMAVGLTIAGAKNVFAYNTLIHRGIWPEEKSATNELFGLTVGVVGCGFAGSHYIELMQDYDVRLIAYDPGLDADSIRNIGAEKVNLDELFRQSDIISLHAPSIKSTYHIVNSESLAMMKQNAILINTARGSLIDEIALAECMNKGKLKYALLDVTDPEPPLPDNPLLSISNVILTPHIAGLANNGKLKIGEHVANEVNRFLSGENLESEVSKEMLATIA